MGNSNSSVETDYLEQIKKIDEDEKTRTDVLLIKSIKAVGGKSGETGTGKTEQTDISTTETTTV